MQRSRGSWLVLAPLVLFVLVSGCPRQRRFDPGKQTPEEMEQLKATAIHVSPMVRIEGGCFKMGTDSPPPAPPGMDRDRDKLCVKGREGQIECYGVYEDEMPAHEVCLDPYEIDLHEVTFEAFQLCAETLICQPSDLGSDDDFWGPKRPATGVVWPAANAFCEWIGKRLPTEAEWEFAARGTDGRTYPWGEAKPECGMLAMRLGEEKDACDRFGTKNVGLYPNDKSPFGLLDMGGNVREWVSDYYHPGYYLTLQGVKTSNPTGPERPLQVLVNTVGDGPDAEAIFLTEQQRVVRGGTWLYAEPLTSYRTTNRRGADEMPQLHGELITLGFRCARSLAAPAPAPTPTPAANGQRPMANGRPLPAPAPAPAPPPTI
jgi:formylglycine-generating enzyme required for sulfatase activity